MSRKSGNKAERMNLKAMWNYCMFQSEGFPLMKVVLVAGTVGSAAVAYVNSFLYAGIIDSLLINNYDLAEKYVVRLVLIVLAITLTSRLSRQVFDFYSRPSEVETRKRTVKKAFALEYEELEKKDTLDSFRRVRQSGNSNGGIYYQLQDIYEFFIYVSQAVFAVIFVGVMLTKAALGKENAIVLLVSTAVLVAVFAGILIVCRKVSEYLGELYLKVQEDNYRINAQAAYWDSVMTIEDNAQDIRMYNLADYVIKRNKEMLRTTPAIVKMIVTNGKLRGMLAFILQLLAGVIYSYIAMRAVYGSVSVGDVLMYAGAIITLMDSIRNILDKKIRIEYSNEYLKYYEEFINRPNMHYDGTLPTEKRDDNEYELEFKNVSFAYPGTEDFIIKDLNLKLTVGEKLALVGRNGAGKTTLVKLLLRMYEPTSGKITLNGIDIGKYDYDEYMRIFAVVFQDFKLFNFPLDENIAGSEMVNDKKVEDVLEKVGLTERVAGMRDGVHTCIDHESANGESLSGGEAQKAAIARALYKDAPFVILDEPTAALDPLAEAEIYENFNELVGDKTSIYISHRMSSCRFCDKIVVLEHGGIAESGTHEELLKLHGSYYELYNAQAQYYTEA